MKIFEQKRPQKPAFEYTDKIKGVCMTFDLSKEKKGYISGGSCDEIWKHCVKKWKELSLYDIARENKPLRLYLDLEFKRKENPDIKDESDHVNLACKFIEEELIKYYNITLDSPKRWKIFTSSDKEIASYHSILLCDDVFRFKDTASLQTFMMLAKQDFENTSSEDFQRLCVIKNGKKGCFIDFSVYTRNRQFRTAFSTKKGQNRYFLPYDRDKKTVKMERNIQDWKNSLVSFSSSESPILLENLGTQKRKRKLVPLSQ